MATYDTPTPTKTTGELQNRLNTMNQYMKQMGGSSGSAPRPQMWIGNGGQKKVVIPADTGGGGKWICSQLKREGLVSTREFIWLTNGHAIAILTNGDFVAWYTKNVGRLVDHANEADFNWATLKHLVDRMVSQYRAHGFKEAFQTYMNICSALYELFGRDDMEIDPFLSSFYNSTKKEKFLGTLKVISGRVFWKQIPLFIRLRLAGV